MTNVFIILDGAADRAAKQLDGKTPLEAARTRNLDYFAKKSNFGYVYTVSEDIAPESDIAVLALLGYDPYKYHTGRGPFEAYGSYLRFKQGDLVLRTNFATIRDNKIVDRRAGRTLTTKEARQLESEINKKVKLKKKFKFKSTLQHRGLLVIEGPLSSNISNVDPAYKRVGKFGVAMTSPKDELLKCEPLDPKNKTKASAQLINEFVAKANEVLKNSEINKKRKQKMLLEANTILPRDAGTQLSILPKKKNWCAVLSMPLEIGISRLAGFTVHKFAYPEMASNDAYDNLYAGLKATIKEAKKAIKLGHFQNYYIHFKETDVCGHDNKPKDKKKMIELIDRKFISFLKKRKNISLVITCDHSSPCSLKVHSSDPVPLMWYNPNNSKKDESGRFTESEAKKGLLGKLYGKNVLTAVGFQ